MLRIRYPSHIALPLPSHSPPNLYSNLINRSPTGTSSLSISLTSTLSDLRTEIQQSTSIPSSKQERASSPSSSLSCPWRHSVLLTSISPVRFGFPPKLISSDGSTTLQSIGLKNGDPVIVAELAEERAPTPTHTPKSTASAPPPPAPLVEKTEPARTAAPAPAVKVKVDKVDYVEVDGGYLVNRVVPDDNSCLFTAIGLVLEPGQPSSSVVPTLRQLIGTIIKSNPETYTSAILGQPPSSYIAIITSQNSWGGAIELAIFSKEYRKEIWSFDVGTGRMDKFGEGEGYEEAVLVVYSGIHYDALTFSYSPPTPSTVFPPPNLEFDTTVFSTSSASDAILIAAQQLVAKLKAEHKYTDTAGFTLKCADCGKAIVGEKEARTHAKDTGHTNFGEYDG